MREKVAMSDSKTALPLSEEPTAAASRRHRCNDADRRGCRVDDVGKFCARNVVAIAERTHHSAHGKAVEVVVNEDQDAKT